MKKQLFFLLATAFCIMTIKANTRINVANKPSNIYTSVVRVFFKVNDQDTAVTIDPGLMFDIADINEITSKIEYEANNITGKSNGAIEIEKLQQLINQQPGKDILIRFVTGYTGTVYPTFLFIMAKK